ncbi:hypothetical protein HO173_006243 [Letharia columbiana]|uniref:Uncharacterized protein n=1 Tax=Letharia columbiana TaxID=112416 RepID=A0A8H6FVJ6_9LECA|nr:uncharacterized protein HO173_006243 [Letharia columbiana]KAF6235560.1 hypothetical protein HO173_006243 [Letharia columbiana]
MTSRLGKEKNSENLAGTQARYGQHLQDLCGRDGWHSQDQHAIRQNLGYGVFERIETIRCLTATTTPRQILSSQGLPGLWMFGDTRQAMGLHLRSTSHGGHGYLRGGSTVTSVPLTLLSSMA